MITVVVQSQLFTCSVGVVLVQYGCLLVLQLLGCVQLEHACQYGGLLVQLLVHYGRFGCLLVLRCLCIQLEHACQYGCLLVQLLVHYGLFGIGCLLVLQFYLFSWSGACSVWLFTCSSVAWLFTCSVRLFGMACLLACLFIAYVLLFVQL